MKTSRILGLVMGILLLGGPAGAQYRTVVQTMNYMNNGNFVTPPFFADPTSTEVHLDGSPYYRTNIEDWNWTHDLTTVRPAAALGIETVTLTITAWDVGSLDEGEDHVIYIGGGTYYSEIFDAWLYDRTGVQLGLLRSFYDAQVTVPWPAAGQRADYANRFSRTTLTIPVPSASADALWNTNQLTFWIDIDQSDPNGNKVTLIDSTLSVKYIIPAPPADSVPVNRFWYSGQSEHFFTSDANESQWLIDNFSDIWIPEGIAFNALPLDTTRPNARPVHRFWSPEDGGRSHFYTINEEEKDQIIRDWPWYWTYEGPVFAAFPEGLQPADAYPVYRFWYTAGVDHFYTMDEAEKQWLSENYADVWEYEGIAFYTYVH
jgi:hypothetical protein